MATPKNEQAAQPEKAKVAEKTQMVKYVGKGSEKVLTQKDFHANDITDQKGARWHNLNGYMVPVDHFSDAALQLVVAQPTLEIVEVDADGTQV